MDDRVQRVTDDRESRAAAYDAIEALLLEHTRDGEGVVLMWSREGSPEVVLNNGGRWSGETFGDAALAAYEELGEWFDANAPDEGELGVVTHDPEEGFSICIVPYEKWWQIEDDWAVGEAYRYLREVEARDDSYKLSRSQPWKGLLWMDPAPGKWRLGGMGTGMSAVDVRELAEKVRARIGEPEQQAPEDPDAQSVFAHVRAEAVLRRSHYSGPDTNGCGEPVAPVAPWQLPETVEGCIEYMQGWPSCTDDAVLVALLTPGDELTKAQTACKYIHAREMEATDAD